MRFDVFKQESHIAAPFLIAIKLAGELGESAKDWIDTCIAICSPLDLKKTAKAIGKTRHYLYQRYYLKRLGIQANAWIWLDQLLLSWLDGDFSSDVKDH